MARRYTQVQELLPEIKAMLTEGRSQREIAEHLGVRDKNVVKDLLKRERRKERKIKAGLKLRPKGRPRKRAESVDIVAEQAYEIKRLKMENTRDLLSIVSDLTARQVEFVSLKENIDTTTPQGRFMLTVFGALAELERENILERQREGIEIAKGAGKYKGRKPLDVDETQFKEVCARWRAGEITATAAMQEVGLKPNTFYRRVKEMGL